MGGLFQQYGNDCRRTTTIISAAVLVIELSMSSLLLLYRFRETLLTIASSKGAAFEQLGNLYEGCLRLPRSSRSRTASPGIVRLSPV